MSKKKAGQTNHKPRGDALQSTLIIAMVINLLLVAAAMLALTLIDVNRQDQRRLQTVAQNNAASQASRISQIAERIQQRLGGFADNTALAAALETGQAEPLAAFRQQLQRTFPEALSTRIVPLGARGTAAFVPADEGIRNNIEIDLIRRANDSGAATPEAYLFDGQWLISFSQAIPGSDARYPSGALLVTLSRETLQQLLEGPRLGGRTELLQTFKAAQTVATSGNGDSAFMASSNTSVDHWQVRFTLSADMAAQLGTDLLPYWGILSVLAISTLACFGLALVQTRRALSRSLQALQQLDRNSSSYPLPGFAEIALALAERVGKPAPPTVRPTPAPAEPAASAEIPSALAIVEEHESQVPDELVPTIFRAYDIRGLADTELTDDVVVAIGRAIGTEAGEQGQQSVIVARDGRHSSARIQAALIKGLRASGRDVVDIGAVPTPLLYFATHTLGSQSGVMITGSHNPPAYNGLKIVIAGRTLSGGAIEALYQRIINHQLGEGSGGLSQHAVTDDYVDQIINDVAIAQPLKIVIDAGNGIPGAIAPRLFTELGCEVIPLFCDVDGDFPNHHPDPGDPKNLQALIAKVKEQNADLGIAFDGDGDRLGVVSRTGRIVPADRLLMLLAQDVVSRNPGVDILFDVKCSRHLNQLISNYGGRPIMWKTGHSFMKEKMQETGALLGGEYSGHIFFRERWFGFDDGMYAAARLIEILSTTDPDIEVHLQAYPEIASTPELKLATTEERKFTLIDALVSQGKFGDGKVTTLDGVRVDYPDGWGLIRASNTTPALILRFEGDTEEALARIQQLFREQLLALDDSLALDF